MWPWGHAAVGYLLYAGYRHARFGLRPRETQALALAVGTQLPDLVDKPLAWQFGLLPNGRSLAHSLLTAGVVLAVLWLWAGRTDGRTDDRALVGAFGVGYLSHLLADGAYAAARGEFAALGYLAYPILPPIQYDLADGGFVAHLLALDFGPTTLVEFGLAFVALALWHRHGAPGLRLVVPDRFLETVERPE